MDLKNVTWLEPQNIISLVGAMLALATAWLGYKTVKSGAPGETKNLGPLATTLTAPPRLVRLVDPAVGTRPWNKLWFLLVWLIITAYFVFLVLHSRHLYGGLIVLAVEWLLITVWWGWLFFLRRAPHSITFRSAEYLFEAPTKELLQRSLAALNRMKCLPGVYDSERGTIEARRRLVFFMGQVVAVRVSDAGENRSLVRIEVDALSPAAVFDFGTNARLVRRFHQRLLEAQV